MNNELVELIDIVAQWCVDIERNGSGWDDWDENYKDARYRPTKNPKLRQMLDKAIKEKRDEYGL